MQKGLYKRSGLEGLFTDFKHHARSWRNSKRMRAKRERKLLKKEIKEKKSDESYFEYGFILAGY